ncbi:MAG: DUF2225 domain-containing protein [Lachnospiraceae bacterium]|nr:DUF2225 domain-containing protein [Lachnospiraceae bacterium]
MGLLSDLSLFGFETDDIELYAKKKQKEAAESETQEQAKVIREEDYLFSKKYECACCGEEFKALSIRAGKARPVGQDDDLRPVYESIDPLKYDAIVCPQCGYAALSRYFKTMMPVQRKKLKEEIMPKFKGMQISEDVYSYDEAIMRYKLVLLCDVVGMGKNSRKAYTCLKLAWVIRGKLEHEDAVMTPDTKKRLHAEELECIQNAYDGYRMAFSSEGFPMSGMDEVTLSYLVAILAFKLGDYRESMQYVANILGNSSVPSRIKNKAIDLKEKIREQVKADHE